jgi:hypothetical protein
MVNFNLIPIIVRLSGQCGNKNTANKKSHI